MANQVNATDQHGAVVLAGGNEFRADCVPMDRVLLAYFKQRARVVIVPTASIKGSPRMAADNGVRHFRELGADAEAAMIITRADADDPRFVDQIGRADLVYLAGGDPPYLRDTLRGSRVWQALRDLFARGGLVAGSSAGAMVLGAAMRSYGLSGDLAETLGLVPNVIVVPHYRPASDNAIQDLYRVVAAAKAVRTEKLTIFGIAEATACLSVDPQFKTWRVAGAGPVAVCDPTGLRRYHDGESFTLD